MTEFERAVHPDDPQEYFDIIEHGHLWALVKPIRGWRFHGVREDGTLFGFPRNSTTTDRARCGRNIRRWQRAFAAMAPEHDVFCGRCGIRVVKDLPTLVDYIRYLAEHRHFEDPHDPYGPAAVAVISVTGSGWAAPIPPQRLFTNDDPENCLRVSQVEMGDHMYLAEQWADGTPVPDDIEDRVREQYPHLTIQRVPTIYQLPGVPFSGLPTPGGNTWHHTGRHGRYGGAGALLRHEDRFLVVRRRDNGLWTPPGGVLDYHDEDPWETAKREAREEGGQIWEYTAHHGHVTFHGEDGWTFKTYAADVHDPVPLRIETREITESQWATADEIADMHLLPEFREVLPELLALFK